MRDNPDRKKMKMIIVGVISLLIGLLIGSFAMKLSKETNNLTAPTGASEELQSAINDSSRLNLILQKLAPPKNGDEWRKWIALVNKQRTVPIEKVAEAYGVEISSDTISGVPVFHVKSKTNDTKSGAIFIHLHGGAYVYYGGDAVVGEAAIIAAYSGIDVISIDYRMPPDHPHPAAIQDVEAVYRALLQDYAPEQIGIGGTSAGSGLALAAIHQFKSRNLAMPGALFLGSPWADLTKTGDTLTTLEGLDRVLVSYEDALLGAAELYANGTPLTDPLLSPIYGDFTDFPPSYLVSGTRDLFLSDTIRTHRKLKDAGVVTDLNIYEGVSHAEYLLVQPSPEFTKTYTDLGAFLNTHLSK
jgi:acetyl esterase/lipase